MRNKTQLTSLPRLSVARVSSRPRVSGNSDMSSEVGLLRQLPILPRPYPPRGLPWGFIHTSRWTHTPSPHTHTRTYTHSPPFFPADAEEYLYTEGKRKHTHQGLTSSMECDLGLFYDLMWVLWMWFLLVLCWLLCCSYLTCVW